MAPINARGSAAATAALLPDIADDCLIDPGDDARWRRTYEDDEQARFLTAWARRQEERAELRPPRRWAVAGRAPGLRRRRAPRGILK